MTDIEICNLALSHIGDWKITALTDATTQGRKCNQWYAQTLAELTRAYRWNFALARAVATVSYKTISGAANNGGFTQYTVTGHAFNAGDYVRVNELAGFSVTNPQMITAAVPNLITTDYAWQGGAYVSGGKVAKCPPHGYAYQMAEPADSLRVLEVGGEYREGEVDHAFEAGMILADYDTLTLRYIRAVTDVTIFDPLFVEALALKLAANLAKPLTGSASREGELLQRLRTDTIPRAFRVDAIEGRPVKAGENEDAFVRARGGRA